MSHILFRATLNLSLRRRRSAFLLPKSTLSAQRGSKTIMAGEDDTNEDENREQLVPKKHSTSGIWDYFGFASQDVSQTQVVCKSCRRIVATSRGNTTNLHSHLQHNHKELYAGFLQSKTTQPTPEHSGKRKANTQASINVSFASAAPYEKNSKRHKALTTAITRYIAKCTLSVNVVGKEGFLEMVKEFDRRYQVPSRTYFSQVAIPEMYDTCVKSVKAELNEVDFYASTTDLWSSRTTEPYMSYTIHFLTSKFELSTRCLEVAYFPDSHTGENIAAALREVLNNWNLPEHKQVAITTDNGANVVKATEINNWVRLQCFGHRLHLAIENAVKGDERITRAVGLCKKLVSHFSHSWKEKTALKNAQRVHNLPEHALITECPTRWGSRQQMIQRVLEQQRALSDVLSADRKSRHLIPTWQDVEVLESMNQALQPLQDFTDALSSESYVSVSYVKPVLHVFNTSILAVKETDTDLTKSIKKKTLDYLNSKYDNPSTQELLDMACLMDPRFKAGYISPDKFDGIKARAISEIQAITPKEQNDDGKRDHSDPPENVQTKHKKSLASFFKCVPAPTSTTTSSSHAVEAELNGYLMSPTIDSEDDPLNWWHVHQVNFPLLSKLARKYLCIPASSSPSERLFSASGNVVTCQRTCLKPDNVNMLVFLAKNLK